MHLKRARATVEIVFLVTAVASVAWAGQGVWTTSGPEAGFVTSVVIDPGSPTTLYAGTRLAGIFKSTDSGDSWFALMGQDEPGRIASLRIASNGVWFATEGSGLTGVWRSTDAGATWTEIRDRSGALAIDPSAPATVYLSSATEVLLKSTDSGDTWSVMDSGIEGVSVTVIAVDPGFPATLYVGTFSNGVFKSTDAGASWTAANTGIENLWVQALAIDPTTTSTLYAGTRFHGVFKSTDSGLTWSPADNGLPADLNVAALAIDPAAPTRLFAATFGGIFRSTDGATTWSELTSGANGTQVNSVTIDATSTAPLGASLTLYSGTGVGVLRSTDGGDTWTEENSGLRAFFAGDVVVDPGTPTTLYTSGGDSGLFKSLDGGATWLRSDMGITHRGTGELAISTSHPQTLYVNLFDDIFKTTNGGAAWVGAIGDPSDFGFIGPAVLPLAVDPTDPDIVFAGQLHPLGNNTAGIYQTVDGGAMWKIAYDPGLSSGFFQPHKIIIDPVNPDRIFASVILGPSFPQIGFNVLRSTDGGDSWDEVLTGSGLKFPELAIDPGSPSTVYAATSTIGGVDIFRSTNGGVTWTDLEHNLATCSLNDLEGDPAGSGALFAACLTVDSPSPVVSTDGGKTWVALDDTGLPTTARAREIAFSVNSPRTLHIGTLKGVHSFSSMLAGLAITKDDGLSEVLPGDTIGYTIEVTNLQGPDDVVGATVTDTLPAQLSSCTWSCLGAAGGVCTATPPAGSLSDTADLPVGGSVIYTANCTVDAAATSPLSNTASVSLPAGFSELEPADNSATDSDIVLTVGACGEFDERVLTDLTVNDTQVFEACSSISAGPGFSVGATGDVILQAPEVRLKNDVVIHGVFAVISDSP